MKKLLSILTAVSLLPLALPMAGVHAASSTVYSFDASSLSSMDATTAKKYGFTFDASGCIWSPALLQDKNSVFVKAVRFTTRNSDSGDYDVVSHYAVNDSMYSPTVTEMTANGYTFEMEFAELYNSEDYMEISFMGKDSAGNEVAFADGRYTFARSDNTQTLTFYDENEQQVGSPSAAFSANNKVDNTALGTPDTLQYLKVNVDIKNGTYSVWQTSHKTGSGAYDYVGAKDDNQLVKGAAMNNKIVEFLGFKTKSHSNAATNGFWIHTINISTLDSSSSGPTPTPTVTPTPTPAPKNLVCDENFKGKKLVDGQLDSWERYDKSNKVDSFTNVAWTLPSNTLKITKTAVGDDETDYSERFRSIYVFKQVYDSDATSKTYSKDLQGKYRIVAKTYSHIGSSSQLQAVNPAFGSGTPHTAFTMCMDSNGVYEYPKSDTTMLYSSSIVDKDTTLTFDVDTTAGTLETSVNGGDAYSKSITAGEPLHGIMFNLKNKAKANDYLTVKGITVYNLDDDPAQNTAATSSKALTIDALTDTPTAVKSSLKTLPSTINGASVEWASSNTDIMSDAGVLQSQPTDADASVTMTATVTKGSDVVYKEFYLTIAKVSVDDYELVQTVDFDNETDSIITDDSSCITRNGGVLTMTRTSASQTPTMKVYPVWGDTRFTATGTWMVEGTVTMPDDYQKAELTFYGKNGKRITTLYTTCTTSATKITAVCRTTESGSAVYKDKSSTSKGAVEFGYRILYNTSSNKMSVYIACDGMDYAALCDNTYLREDADGLAYIQLSAPSDNSSGDATKFSTVEFGDIKLYTLETNKLDTAMNNFNYTTPVEALGGYIRSNVTLSTNTFEGMTASWSSSNTAILTNDGVLNTKAYTEDTPLTLTFRLSLDGSDKYIEKAYPLTAVWIDPDNLAVEKTIDVGNVISMTGHSPSKANDGALTSYWQTMRYSDIPTITIDLGDENVIEDIVLKESPVADGVYTIGNYAVETSRDGKSWSSVHTGTALGENSVSIDVNAVIARYVRLRVISKDMDNCCGLYEFMVYGARDDATRAYDDIIWAADKIGSLSNMSSNKTMPATGIYGSTLTYSSSIPKSFTNSGTVIKSSAIVKGTLTITATNNGATATKDYPVSVAKTATSGSSGGGGGGGGGSTTGSANTIPARATASASTAVSTTDSVTWQSYLLEAFNITDTEAVIEWLTKALGTRH